MLGIVSSISSIFVAAVIGGWLAHRFQLRSWLFQQRFSRHSTRYESQLHLTQSIFRLVDKRIHASRIYADAIATSDLKIIQAQRADYQMVVAEWNTEISGHIILMEVRFDAYTAREFEDYFLPEFERLDRALRTARKKAEVKQPAGALGIDGQMRVINARARDFMRELMSQIDMTMQVVEERPKITIDNLDNLSHGYLIKALFKPRH